MTTSLIKGSSLHACSGDTLEKAQWWTRDAVAAAPGGLPALSLYATPRATAQQPVFDGRPPMKSYDSGPIDAVLDSKVVAGGAREFLVHTRGTSWSELTWRRDIELIGNGVCQALIVPCLIPLSTCAYVCMRRCALASEILWFLSHTIWQQMPR